MTTQMTVADTLRAAAQEIEKRGWHQGSFFSPVVDARTAQRTPTVRCCAIGALDLVPSGVYLGALYHLRDTLGVGTEWVSVAQWNDHPERTQDEVVSTLRAAADQWEADNVA